MFASGRSHPEFGVWQSSFQTISHISIPRKQIWEKVFHFMYCYAYDTCMHDTKVWNDMLCTWFITRPCTKTLKDKEEKNTFSLNLIFFYFFQISTFWLGHTIPIILYSTNIFRKKLLFFDHFQTRYIFF